MDTTLHHEPTREDISKIIDSELCGEKPETEMRPTFEQEFEEEKGRILEKQTKKLGPDMTLFQANSFLLEEVAHLSVRLNHVMSIFGALLHDLDSKQSTEVVSKS